MRELSRRGIQFTLLSFERRGWTQQDRRQAECLDEALESWGIDWRYLRYRRVPGLPNSVADIVRGAAYAIYLIRRKQIELVHTRSYVPAFMTLLIRRFVPVKFVFDMRGLMLEEYVDAGHWAAHGWQYRISKRVESSCLHRADAVVTMSTELHRHVLGLAHGRRLSRDELNRRLWLIPNCTDTARFRPDPETRCRMRERFGFGGCLVFVWLVGNIRKWHMPDEVLSFFKVCKRKRPESKLLILTLTDNVEEMLASAGLVAEDYLVLSAPPEQVHQYVLSGDVGLSISDPNSVVAPVKVAEYLASGLPAVVNAGQAGFDSVIRDTEVGAVIDDLSSDGYSRAAADLFGLLDTVDNLQARCRRVANEHYSLEIAVEKYERVYQHVLD